MIIDITIYLYSLNNVFCCDLVHKTEKIIGCSVSLAETGWKLTPMVFKSILDKPLSNSKNVMLLSRLNTLGKLFNTPSAMLFPLPWINLTINLISMTYYYLREKNIAKYLIVIPPIPNFVLTHKVPFDKCKGVNCKLYTLFFKERICNTHN